LKRKDLAAAEKALSEAERLDRDLAEVKAVRAEFERAKREAAAGDKDKTERVKLLLSEARDALKRKDLAAAEKAVSEAEKLDRDLAEVRTVRADLEAAKRGAPPPQRYDEAKLSAALHAAIFAEISKMETHNAPGDKLLDRYRAAANNKALTYCVDWSKVRVDAVPPGAAAMHSGREDDKTVQARALDTCRQRGHGACTCILVDANGRNVLRVPAEVVERLNRNP
jgi:hypothetical protein